MFCKIGLTLLSLFQSTVTPTQVDFIVNAKAWEVGEAHVYQIVKGNKAYKVAINTDALNGSIESKTLNDFPASNPAISNMDVPAQYLEEESPELIREGSPEYWHLSVHNQKLLVEENSKHVPVIVSSFFSDIDAQLNLAIVNEKFDVDFNVTPESSLLLVPLYQDETLRENGRLKVLRCESLGINCASNILVSSNVPHELVKALNGLVPFDNSVHSRVMLLQNNVYYLPVPFKK
ncbi:hypothetical protein ACNO5E_15825 [Vibrio parahaemolyticus]|uniref:hypothetical protein n=1 Tax=Vibrio cincinnatiensis TaxID=675 RepID=UPI001EDD9170|nr:hypothetical protein [Vibrio cincinnatiensis]MCG3761132.1 hypothetical protein [Vibrio cincinnatiensis]